MSHTFSVQHNISSKINAIIVCACVVSFVWRTGRYNSDRLSVKFFYAAFVLNILLVILLKYFKVVFFSHFLSFFFFVSSYTILYFVAFQLCLFIGKKVKKKKLSLVVLKIDPISYSSFTVALCFIVVSIVVVIL